MEYLIRFGFIVRGILYLLTGFYGLQAAIGSGNNAKTNTDVINTLSSTSFGGIVLIAVLAGCVGYGIWGLVRALRPGSVFVRLGYLVSSLSYFALSLIPLHLSTGTKNPAFMLLQLPWGNWLIVLAGIVVIIGGFGQIIYGYEENFKKTLKKPDSKKQEKVIETTGKYGYMARGVVFILLGISFIFGRTPGGAVILAVTSAGLAALGIYSIIASRSVKIKIHDKT